MNAPDTRRRLAHQRKPAPARKPRHSAAFLAELRRQCKLANESDRRDDWRQYVHLPE